MNLQVRMGHQTVLHRRMHRYATVEACTKSAWIVLEWWGYPMVKKLWAYVYHLHTIPACDGQTSCHSSRYAYASRDKNWTIASVCIISLKTLRRKRKKNRTRSREQIGQAPPPALLAAWASIKDTIAYCSRQRCNQWQAGVLRPSLPEINVNYSTTTPPPGSPSRARQLWMHGVQCNNI